MTRLLVLTILPAIILALITTTRAFTPTTRGYSTRIRCTFLKSDTNDGLSNNNNEPPEEQQNANTGEEQAALPRAASFEPQLISTVTAVNPNLEEAEDTGVIPRDGSLLLLIPSLVISVGGFLAAIGIALNSGDAISQAVNEMEQSYVDSFKPKPAVYTPSETCRGLCSNQQEDLDGLRSFMQKISRTTTTVSSDASSSASSLEMDTDAVLVDKKKEEENSLPSVVSTESDVVDGAASDSSIAVDVPSSADDVVSTP
mmetsp:Transcript_28709/g.44634  ORF Transcript_28709/g.44634 Transcript_28709/m.44634 type:complete len:257 (-) Transcript_28709:70-840(-)